MENANLNTNAAPNETKPAIKLTIGKSSIIEAILVLVIVFIAMLLVNTGLSLWLATFISVFAILNVTTFAFFFILFERNKKNGKTSTFNVKAFIRNIVIFAAIAAVVAFVVSGVAFIFC